ncbi:MAG: TIR domain-containing protein [Anaerolineae bacterium]
MDEHDPLRKQLSLLVDDDVDDIEDDEELEPIEAYCVRCRQMVEMTDPEAVWTSKGTPGTRGSCINCGTTVFRMGKTPAHEAMARPTAIRVGTGVKVALDGKRKRTLPATYINFDQVDAEFAEKLAVDLENSGVHTWIDTGEVAPEGEEINWAGGVHPALKDSARMVIVLSTQAAEAEALTKAWSFFKTQKKPIVLAMLDGVAVPDALRRTPRFDFRENYKTAFRQLVAALSD